MPVWYHGANTDFPNAEVHIILTSRLEIRNAANRISKQTEVEM